MLLILSWRGIVLPMKQDITISLHVMYRINNETERLGNSLSKGEENLLRSLLTIKNLDLPPFSLNCIGQERLYLSVQLVTVRTLWARLSNWNQDGAQYNGFLLVSAPETNDIGEVRKMAYWWVSETVLALMCSLSISDAHFFLKGFTLSLAKISFNHEIL